MKNKLSIGEMAAIHGIGMKTLRYYDEIGLFSPVSVHPETGYRYYAVEQFELLNMIKHLKSLGIPLKEIRNHVQQKSLENFIHLLKKEEQTTKKRIQELSSSLGRLNHRIKELEQTQDQHPLNVPHLLTIPQQYAVESPTSPRPGKQLEYALRALENSELPLGTVDLGRVALTLSVENFQKGHYQCYSSLLILLNEQATQNITTITLPGGLHLRMLFCSQNHEESPLYYQQLHDFMMEQDFIIHGPAIERVITNEWISHNPRDWRTEILIPIKGPAKNS
ncbi:MAG: MerR family transcriptional regulator [Spirochaetales bacterium]|nr:MerR family transcriptional regulator [Spirochaetales bacterium]